MNINDYLNSEALDDLLEKWAAATNMIAVVLDDEGNFLSNKLGFSRNNIEAFSEDIEVDDVVVASVVGGPLDEDAEDETVEMASQLLVVSIQNLLEASYRKAQYEETMASFTSVGSPGPLERKTPSGLQAATSSAVAFQGKTVRLHPRRSRDRRIFSFMPI